MKLHAFCIILFRRCCSCIEPVYTVHSYDLVKSNRWNQTYFHAWLRKDILIYVYIVAVSIFCSILYVFCYAFIVSVTYHFYDVSTMSRFDFSNLMWLPVFMWIAVPSTIEGHGRKGRWRHVWNSPVQHVNRKCDPFIIYSEALKEGSRNGGYKPVKSTEVINDFNGPLQEARKVIIIVTFIFEYVPYISTLCEGFKHESSGNDVLALFSVFRSVSIERVFSL